MNKGQTIFSLDTDPEIENAFFSDDARRASVPGRRLEIDDEELIHKRDVFTQYFEHSWGDLGWMLPRARSRQSIAEIFGRVGTKDNLNLISDFLHLDEQESSATDLRSMRRNLSTLDSEIRSKYEEWRLANEQFEITARALEQLKGPQRKKIRRWLGKSDSERERLKSEWDCLEATRRKHENSFAAMRAFFCRSELLKFIGSKRYEFTPLNFGGAMAGLPFIGWRRSFLRCSRHKRDIVQALPYEMFLIIQRVLDNPSKERELEVVFRKALSRGPIGSLYGADYLRAHWHDLKKTLRECNPSKIHPKELPFRISAKLQHNLNQPKGPVDQILQMSDKFKPLL